MKFIIYNKYYYQYEKNIHELMIYAMIFITDQVRYCHPIIYNIEYSFIYENHY